MAPVAWLFTLAVAAVAALAAWEFLGLAKNSGANPPRIAVLVAILALFACNLIWDQRDHTAAIMVVLSLALLVYCTFFRPVDPCWPTPRPPSSASYTSVQH